jgi:hypothetical protein
MAKLYEIENYLEKKVRRKDWKAKDFYIYFKDGLWFDYENEYFFIVGDFEGDDWEEYIEANPHVKKYVKLPIPIEAIQFTPETVEQCAEWLGDRLIVNIAAGSRDHRTVVASRSYQIKTLEGDHNLIYGDYIIKGIRGEFYPVKEEIFLESYKEFKNE